MESPKWPSASGRSSSLPCIGSHAALLLNRLGVYHFDQIAAWTEAEVAWVDDHLEGFSGRVERDEWVAQAQVLVKE